MALSSVLRSVLLMVAACSLLTGASATFVMFGDSFSDDGRGANPVVQDALSNAAVRMTPCSVAIYCGACLDLTCTC